MVYDILFMILSREEAYLIVYASIDWVMAVWNRLVEQLSVMVKHRRFYCFFFGQAESFWRPYYEKGIPENQLAYLIPT